MLLDEFGQPLRKPIGFITPRWVAESMLKFLRADVEAISNLTIEQRIDDLYESAEVERPERRVIGNTIRMNAPERFTR